MGRRNVVFHVNNHVTIHQWEINYLLCVGRFVYARLVFTCIFCTVSDWAIKWQTKWTELHHGGSRDPSDPLDPPTDYTTQMKHVCHHYADQLVVGESTLYFAQA